MRESGRYQRNTTDECRAARSRRGGSYPAVRSALVQKPCRLVDETGLVGSMRLSYLQQIKEIDP